MKPPRAIWPLILLVAALAACSSAEAERAKILGRTPLGTGIELVLRFCEEQHLTCNRSDTAGFLNQDTGRAVGVRSVWAVVDAGRFRDVSVFWGFDSEGKLLDVWAWSTFEGL